MKRLILCFMLTLFVGPVFSQNTLIVNLKDGQTINVGLSSTPTVTYSDTKLIIQSTIEELEFSISDVDKFTFTEVIENSVQSPTNKETQVQAENGIIFIFGCKAEEEFVLISTDGKVLATYKADKNNTASFSIAEYTSGVYIIKSSSVSFKFVKK